jgi:predicted nucleotidyltransferase
MPLRGEEQRAAIRGVLDTFGEDAQVFVFIGGCTLGLYARRIGAPLRVTKDVDCISTLSPWVLQENKLGEMCSRGILTPDADLQCRYRIRDSGILVDVLSPEGFNVGGVNRWFARAAQRARRYDAGDGRSVLAVSPPYFLAMKLEAFKDRGPDAQSSKDAEDIVSLAVEIEDLIAQVDAEGLRPNIAELWASVLNEHGFASRDLADFVDWHLDRRESEHRDRVIDALAALVRG